MSENKSADDIVDELFKDSDIKSLQEVIIPSGRTVHIRPITWEIEKELVSENVDTNAITKFMIDRCTTGVDYEDLLSADATYILFKIRELSYGSIFKFVLGCPSCKAEQEYSVDISDLPVEHMDEISEVEVELPVSKKTVKVRRATMEDVGMTDTAAKAMDNIWRFVKSFEGIDRKDVISKVMKRLSAGDIETIMQAVNGAGYGIQTKIRTVCNQCGYDGAIELPLSQSFFSVS